MQEINSISRKAVNVNKGRTNFEGEAVPDPDVDERAPDGQQAEEGEGEGMVLVLVEERADRLVDVLGEEDVEPVVEVAPDVRRRRRAREVAHREARHRRLAEAVHLHRRQCNTVHHCILKHAQTEYLMNDDEQALNAMMNDDA